MTNFVNIKILELIMPFGGGGKLGDASLEAKTAFEAAKQLGGEAAKVVDAKSPRCEDAKSVTEKIFVNSGDEHESIVGWGCEIADEWLTRGARNEIHICDSNMNGSSEREAISRRYPNNETYYSISLLPSIALAIVISSAYSRSAPTGKPNAIREIFTPKGFINLFK